MTLIFGAGFVCDSFFDKWLLVFKGEFLCFIDDFIGWDVRVKNLGNIFQILTIASGILIRLVEYVILFDLLIGFCN